jgi:hypothetical protein
MSDIQFTPTEQVIRAFNEMANTAKPYRRTVDAQGDPMPERVVLSHAAMEALRDAINALPGDAFDDKPDLERLKADDETRRRECEGYGLPADTPLAGLLRHIYANRDTVYAANDEVIAILERRLAAAERAEPDLQRQRYLLDALGGFESPQAALEAIDAGRRVLGGLAPSDRECVVLHAPYCVTNQGDTPCKVTTDKQPAVPPPIKPLPIGTNGLTAWAGLRHIAEFFDFQDNVLEYAAGMERDRDAQRDLRMWADELERRFA